MPVVKKASSEVKPNGFGTVISPPPDPAPLPVAAAAPAQQDCPVAQPEAGEIRSEEEEQDATQEPIRPPPEHAAAPEPLLELGPLPDVEGPEGEPGPVVLGGKQHSTSSPPGWIQLLGRVPSKSPTQSESRRQIPPLSPLFVTWQGCPIASSTNGSSPGSGLTVMRKGGAAETTAGKIIPEKRRENNTADSKRIRKF